MLLWFLSLIFNLDSVSWDDRVVEGLDFLANHVLQVPLFLMTLMRYVTPTLDNLYVIWPLVTMAHVLRAFSSANEFDSFMESLRWVDMTYVQKHKHDNPSDLRNMYYPNLRQYSTRDGTTHTTSTAEAVSMFLWRSVRKASISLAVYSLTYVPVIGRFVLPAASFYTFNRAVGLGPASVIFGAGVFVPKRNFVIFLQSYFASRRLVRELLEPYFARVRFTSEQKRNWFRSREGILFGFGIGFYALLRVPLLGVLIYGIAEASTAYLITKVTDPPPAPSNSDGFAASQQEWKNKQKFLSLSLKNLDTIHDKPPAYSEVDPHPDALPSGS